MPKEQLLSVAENIDINKIKLGNQLRQNPIQNITELADSIQKVGLLEPIIVRVNIEGYFEVVSGCRRYTACKALGRKSIMCIVIEANDKDAFEMSLVENIQRTSLEPLEMAQAFKKYVSKSGWGGLSELAFKIGRSHSFVTKYIMLLDLPQDIINLVKNEQLDTSKAQELFPIKNNTKQSEVAKMVVSKQLSSRDIRHLVNDMTQSEIDSSGIEHSHQVERRKIRRTERSLNKAILILRVAMGRIGELVDEYEDNWFVHESLMEEKNVIHNQIDSLLKKKKRLVKMILNEKVAINSPNQVTAR